MPTDQGRYINPMINKQKKAIPELRVQGRYAYTAYVFGGAANYKRDPRIRMKCVQGHGTPIDDEEILSRPDEG